MGENTEERLRNTNTVRGSMTKTEYAQDMLDHMETSGTFASIHTAWADDAVHVSHGDSRTEVCSLKQTCTSKGARRKFITTISDVFILDRPVGLDEARTNTQTNTQGVWPCWIPVHSFPWRRIAQSNAHMSEMRRLPRLWINTPCTHTCTGTHTNSTVHNHRHAFTQPI